jgi:crossover junction endodeoxyribonuclease RuvC
VIVGIDPGLSGAIVGLCTSGNSLIDAWDMPVAGGIVTAQHLADIAVCCHAWGVEQCVIEDVHSMPKQGVASSFKFGRSLGVVEGVFGRFPLTYVSPAKWKKDMRVTADKGMARRRACELWPDAAHHFVRVKDDGRAEAALIARWWLDHGRPR